MSTEGEVRKKEERIMFSLCSGDKIHSSGPEMHAKAKTSAENSEWNVNGMWVNTTGILKVPKCSNTIELRYLEILLCKIMFNWKTRQYKRRSKTYCLAYVFRNKVFFTEKSC